MNQDERNQLIEEYGRGFDFMNAVLVEIPRDAWEFKPPGEWSVHEILIHMADSEMMGVIRLYKLIAEPGDTLMIYDSDNWAKALDYQNQDVDDALQIFKLLRRTTYRLLKNLPDQVSTHSVIHPAGVYPEYGEGYTLWKWLNIYTRHVREHTEQLKRTYRERESQRPKMT